MILSAVVTIILNGTIVAGVAPARIAGGRVVAPLTPVVVQLATRAAYDAKSATVILERNGFRLVVPVAFVENSVPYVAIGPVVERFGGSASFDTRTKTLAIVMRSGGAIATPLPFDSALPQVEPNPVFTPNPPPATPRAVESGLPRPRRTAIPVVPSQPVVGPSGGTPL